MKKNIPTIVSIAIFIILSIIYINYDTKKTEEYFTELEKEYPEITVEEQINARITGIFNVDPKISRNDDYQVYIILDHSVKRDLHALRDLKEDLTVDEVVEVGDVILKTANSYTFHLYKFTGNDTLKYEFELCDRFRYSLRKNKPH